MWHMQRTTPNWKESLYLLPDGAMVKATGGYEIFSEVKAINPKIFTVHRMVRESLERYHGTSDSGWFNWEIAKDLAREWFDAFVDGTFYDKIAQHTDAVSWHNEIWADSQNQVERNERIEAAKAAVYIWNTEYRPKFKNDIRLIIGEAAPGNGMPRAIAELAINSDNIVGYHPYEWWNRKVRSDYSYRRMTSLRFDVMEQEWGLKPTWAFTEAGPLESAVTGWRAKECLDGDPNLYVEAVGLWMQDVAKTKAYLEGRILGFALFTTFSIGDQKWGSFHTQQPEMNEMAKKIKQLWKPGENQTVPEEPLPEDPSEEQKFQVNAWEITVDKQVSGSGGLRLNAKAAIQQRINRDNLSGLNLQIVTDEVIVDGKTVQAAESLTNSVPRRVYVWEEGKPIYWFTTP